MASITDIIAQQVAAAAGNATIPSGIQNQVINGLSESILGSLTQTASQAGGTDILKNLLSGKTSAAQSPVTALAGKLFANNVLKQLGLGQQQSTALAGLVPAVIGKLSGAIKDMDGDGDVDLTDIILSLKGGSTASSSGSLLGAATSILGGLLKKK